MKRLNLLCIAVLLTGASDPWVDASSQDLNGYARALSLDLRGVVPTEAELEAIEDAGGIDETTLDAWLASPGFEEQVILEHREHFWNLLDINLLATRRLNLRNGIYFNNRRARYTRLATQTDCGEFEATVDEFNSPVEGSVQVNDDGSLSEGYVWVSPYWAPDTTVKVCAFDAQTRAVTDEGIDCTTDEGFEDPLCGCGPNLQWCIDNNRERLIEQALAFDLNERVREMLQAGGEKLVAYRRGSRLVARLARTTVEAAGMPIPEAPYRLIIEKKGTFEDLKFVPFEPRTLGSTQVAVKVLSAGLNFRDVMGVLDVYPGEAGPLGGECIGEVTELGSAVKDFKVGDVVMVPLTESCMSTQTISEELLTCRVPKNLSINQASTIPVVYSTALHGLKNLAKLKKGERILIHAGAGGVGLAAIYIAKHIGAEVFATASEKKRDFLRKIGVEHVFDSRSLDFAQQIRNVTGGDGVDVVLNSLAGEFITTSMQLLNEGGRFIEIGKADIWTQDRVKAFREDIYYEAFDLVIVTLQNPNALRELMEEIVENVEAGHYQPLPYTVFKHKEAMDAFRYMAQGKHIGKILINRDDPAIEVKADRSYLITGATGGLGMLFANWFADHGAGEVILAARRDVRDVDPDGVKAIEAKGTRVTTVKADSGDRDQVVSMMATVKDSSLPLAGIIHAAGVLADAFVVNQDMASFEKVMAPKLAGAWYLHQETKDLPLDMFVLFSSLSCLSLLF